MQGAQLIEVEQTTTKAELDQLAWELALENASSYGIEPPNYDEPEQDDEEQIYSGENIEGWWEEYNPEKHDGIL